MQSEPTIRDLSRLLSEFNNARMYLVLSRFFESCLGFTFSYFDLYTCIFNFPVLTLYSEEISHYCVVKFEDIKINRKKRSGST